MKPLRILLIEDEGAIRKLLEERLSREGYEVRSADSGRSGLALLETSAFDAALLDINLPDMTGIEILEQLKNRDPDIDAVIITGFPEIESAIQALRLGAYDYLTKPIEWAALQHRLRRLAERRYLRDEVDSLRSRLAETLPIGELVGTSAPMVQLKETIARVASSDSGVLIEGESGTGKELVAYAIHRLSKRAKGPFVPVNCAAIPAELMESEIFGHVRGAFSSATADSRGLFRSAHGGTLFLDEIGDLPLALQPKLLRILQEREVRPVGSSETHRVDVRLVAATNQNLEEGVRSGKFRQDLFFRLNVVRLETPPLRSIREDIAPLTMSLIRKLSRRFGKRVHGIAPDALQTLMRHDFPGNVRELENMIERAFALGAEDEITTADLPPLGKARTAPVEAAAALPPSFDHLEREFIAAKLRENQNDKARAAEALGISERTLYRRLRKHGLS
ncbi:MAG TPA: sigma-54 dependent transcriptional regulator [Terriglobia bacterium]|nr:sigma-54 dependent transcriptional regulator [Terriglobia bacterium]